MVKMGFLMPFEDTEGILNKKQGIMFYKELINIPCLPVSLSIFIKVYFPL